MAYYNKKLVELSHGETDFGVCDRIKSGPRAVGYAWRIFKVTYTEKPAEENWGYHVPEGFPLEGSFEVTAYPTRNGRHYGAGAGNVPCKTLAEAEAVIAKRTAAARKRELKRFGP